LKEQDCFEIKFCDKQITLPTRCILTTKIQPCAMLKKARLVVQSHHQISGKDFMVIYAPTLCEKFLRLVLMQIYYRRMFSHQLDVICPFIHCDIERVVYIGLSPAIYTAHEIKNKIRNHKKSLNSLKQSPML
jgi:Reverse transcriptase (RNA-dependent DNA polymerase)